MKKLLKKIIVLTMLLGSIGTTAEVIQPEATVQAAKKTKKHSRKSRVKKSKLRVDSRKKGKKRKLKRKKNLIPWANVYINSNDNSADYRATVNAINAWNNTKTVKFRIVNNPSYAYITVNHANYGRVPWAGEEITRKSSKGVIRSEIRLNDYYMAMVDEQVQIDVAEHELGHSMGLQHLDGQPSVMNTVLNPEQAYSIQPVDIATVKALYHEK